MKMPYFPQIRGSASWTGVGIRGSVRSLLAARQRTYVYLGYLIIAAAGEILLAMRELTLGVTVHVGLLVALLAHSVLAGQNTDRNLALALTAAPLIRLLSTTLPLFELPQVLWYPVVAIPLLSGVWFMVRQAGYTRQELRLRIGHPLIQAGIACGGFCLGLVEYFILRPATLPFGRDWLGMITLSLVLLVFTGFNEEVIFRGVMQTAAEPVLGRGAIGYVVMVFGILHIGYLSPLDFIFVTIVGLVFAYLARWSGSIFGVTLAHGLTNIMLFVVMPLVAEMPSRLMVGFVGTESGLGVLAAVCAAVLLWKQPAKWSRVTLRTPAGRAGWLVRPRHSILSRLDARNLT